MSIKGLLPGFKWIAEFLLTLSNIIQNRLLNSNSWICLQIKNRFCFKSDLTGTQNIYQDSKIFVDACCLLIAKLDVTGLCAIWTEKHAPNTRILPKEARKESNVPKLWSYCPNVYNSVSHIPVWTLKSKHLFTRSRGDNSGIFGFQSHTF